MKQPPSPSLLRRISKRVFPRMPDFFQLLTEQCPAAWRTAQPCWSNSWETGDPETGKLIRRDEHEADQTKVRNLHTLNEAFSTPIDREDLYRAIIDLDEVVNYCKTTVSEMDVLALAPDKHCLRHGAAHQAWGRCTLALGYAKLSTDPAGAAVDADSARKAERRVEKAYRHAIRRAVPGRRLHPHVQTPRNLTATCRTPPTGWPTAQTPCTTSW